MKKFVFIYNKNGGVANVPMDEVLKTWTAWFGELGAKLVDGGNPFNDGAKAVTKDGVSSLKSSPASGYSIVNASNVEEATELAKGCPMLKQVPNGEVQVYEALPM